jgi:Zn-finger nucleic acid-binding protein
MTCPRCAGRTRKLRVKSVQLDRCSNCQGTWFDADELRVLKDREKGGDYRWIDIDLWRDRAKFRAGRQEKLVCPKDGETMTTVRYGRSAIRVEICGVCEGVWLDQGEYAKITAYLEKKVNEETVSDYLHELREEFVDLFKRRKGVREEVADMAKVVHLLELRFSVEHSGIVERLRRTVHIPGA